LFQVPYAAHVNSRRRPRTMSLVGALLSSALPTRVVVGASAAILLNSLYRRVNAEFVGAALGEKQPSACAWFQTERVKPSVASRGVRRRRSERHHGTLRPVRFGDASLMFYTDPLGGEEPPNPITADVPISRSRPGRSEAQRRAPMVSQGACCGWPARPLASGSGPRL